MPRRLARWVAGPIVTAVAATWRVEARHPERWPARGPAVILLWHEHLLPLLWHHRHREVSIVVSAARDGQYLVDYAGRLGYRAIEGSSHRGRLRAMRGVLEALRAGAVVGITPDGPRGPRREIKPGALAAAQATGAAVVPVVADARPARRLGSWDRFLVPAPLARVRIAYGTPFTVEAGEAALAASVDRAASALGTLEREIAWRGATPTA